MASEKQVRIRQEKKELVEMIIEYATEKELTSPVLWGALEDAIRYMKMNAILPKTESGQKDQTP